MDGEAHATNVRNLVILRNGFLQNINYSGYAQTEYALKKINEYFLRYLNIFETSCMSCLEIWYDNFTICTRESIFNMLDNKRTHALTEAEVRVVKCWIDGEDITEMLKPLYFEAAYNEDNIGEFLHECFGNTQRTPNV